MITKLVISLLIPQIIGLLGSLITAPAVKGWYASALKPSITPPSWLFAPVWTLLFLLMGTALYLVWSKPNVSKKKALVVFGVQLFLNFLWSAFFFGLRSPFLAFMEIIVLWGFILLNIIYFLKISKEAGLLLVPYLLWVSFAAVLNFSFLLLT